MILCHAIAVPSKLDLSYSVKNSFAPRRVLSYPPAQRLRKVKQVNTEAMVPRRPVKQCRAEAMTSAESLKVSTTDRRNLYV